MPPDGARPLVGVGVLVIRDGRVLLGERRGAHGTGSWALPGGHLEFGETVEGCAARELLEETGMMLGGGHRGPWTSDIFPDEGRHYVTLFVIATGTSGEPVVREPEKCTEWRWCDWDDLPVPLFPPLASLKSSGFVPEG